MVTRRMLVRVLVVVCLAVCAIWWSRARGVSAPTQPNVVLISLDTCRADHLSCYRKRDPMTTPHIDAFAHAAVLFENVISPVPLTFPAHCSMLTGMVPPGHGVRDNISYRLTDSNVTLAELLRERGYRTGAVIGAAVLDARTGLSQGFDTYDDQVGVAMTQAGPRPERRGDEVSRLAEAWLDKQASEPFFLFVHYFDPHYPYEPPEPFASRFEKDPYAGEVAYADQCVGRVIDKLKRLGLYDSSLIIVAGDHGESLGEHGETEHGYFIYHSATKVPLIVKRPGGGKARRIADAVSLADIVPTVLGQLGAPIPSETWGEDLSPYLGGRATRDEKRFLYSESLTATRYGCSALLGVETNQWKYIRTSRPELYDLTSDPGERHNVIDENPQRARMMQGRLESILEENRGPGGDDATAAMSADELERLHALGYTGGPIDESFESDDDREDPKDFIEFYLRIDEIDKCRARRDRARAKLLAEGLLAERPGIVQVRRTLARFAIEDGEDQAAISHYTQLLALAPESDEVPGWHNNLGILLARQGRLEEAIAHYREALRLAALNEQRPDSPSRSQADVSHALTVVYSAHLNLGNTLLDQGKAEEAAEEYYEAIRVRSADPTAHFQLGMALVEMGSLDGAADAFEEALRLDPRHPTARRELEIASTRRRTGGH